MGPTVGSSLREGAPFLATVPQVSRLAMFGAQRWWARALGAVLHAGEAGAWLAWGLGGAGDAVGVVFAAALMALAVAVAAGRGRTVSLANAVATEAAGLRLIHGPAPAAVVVTMVASAAVLVVLGPPWGRQQS